MFQVIAYLKDKDKWEKEDIDASKLTFINYSFAKVDDGKCVENFTKIHLINEVKKENPHLRTCLSIGGWTADGFSDACLSKESRSIFIQSIYDIVKKYDFDGVDLDWEYPGIDEAGIVCRDCDVENFLNLVKEMRMFFDSKEDGKYYYITSAIGAKDYLIDSLLIDGKNEYAKYLDYINVMTYDVRNGYKTGHHTNLYSYESDTNTSVDNAVNMLINQGVDKKKIIIGCAFYSRIWEGVEFIDDNHLNVNSKNPGLKVIDYNFLEDYINENNLKYRFDEVAKAPYLYNNNTFVSYDDEKSVREKTKYIKQQQLGGIMFWEYSLDIKRTLLNAIDDEISNS